MRPLLERWTERESGRCAGPVPPHREGASDEEGYGDRDAGWTGGTAGLAREGGGRDSSAGGEPDPARRGTVARAARLIADLPAKGNHCSCARGAARLNLPPVRAVVETLADHLGRRLRHRLDAPAHSVLYLAAS
jgi:hypothetical protein